MISKSSILTKYKRKPTNLFCFCCFQNKLPIKHIIQVTVSYFPISQSPLGLNTSTYALLSQLATRKFDRPEHRNASSEKWTVSKKTLAMMAFILEIKPILLTATFLFTFTWSRLSETDIVILPVSHSCLSFLQKQKLHAVLTIPNFYNQYVNLLGVSSR